MNNVLFDYLDVFCIAYLNDIIVYFNDSLKYEVHVKKVLARLQEYGFLADICKSEFHVKKIKFLGFFVTIEGIEIDPTATECVCDWRLLLIIRGVQFFLGFCNFYRRFIPDYGKIAKFFVELIKPFVPFDMIPPRMKAFEELKLAVLALTCLKYYNAALETRVKIDASDGVILGVFL